MQEELDKMLDLFEDPIRNNFQFVDEEHVTRLA